MARRRRGQRKSLSRTDALEIIRLVTAIIVLIEALLKLFIH